ncbi:peptidoglycan DD-metalloendopeptidase family protein [Exiguobacterium flavidum]|uniref:peptidoglycan DD-metalloendopeptidase family protein n=1 Tax=Exiguobacterium flavidum TaxID=2184695 RepID=UPI000DF80A75|nr:peptidoglycan DD-metalloendopeptidase family protein [Exiguobacterium flavidum]
MKRFLTTMTMTAMMVSGFAMTGTEKVEAATITKVKIMDNGLRVRAAASTKSTVVGVVNKGQTFNYLGKSGSWTKISYKNKTRYVYTAYTKTYKATVASKASSGFMKPASGSISQGYGKASGAYGYTFHNGIDIAAPTGTSVYASAAGTVITSKNYGAYGNYIMMSHTVNGVAYTTVYAHLNSRGVSVGDKVAKGEKIGTVGNTGNSFGSHLHFEIHRGAYIYSSSTAANSLNPLNFF